MRAYISVMDRINSALKFVLVLFVAVTFAALFVQVFSRFVFQIPITWTEELSRYLMIWIAFIGASLAIRHHQLIRIEAITDFMPRKMQIAVNFIATIFVLVFCAVVFYYGLDLIKVVRVQTSPALGVPMAVPYFAIPLGAVLMFCNAIVGLLDFIKKGNTE